MRVLVSGVSGLLGLNTAFELRGKHRVHGCWHRHSVTIPGVDAVPVDLADLGTARRVITAVRPDVIVHTAALTDVDRCEDDPEAAFVQNVQIAENVARLATECGARLVHISTDHLFDGTKPMRTETEPVAPLNEYARTKHAAEVAVAAACPSALIVRTNFFGWGSPIRSSFSDWVLEGLRRRRELTMFTDSHFTPILANDLVALVLALLDAGAEGVYHVGGRDRVSKYEFALQLAEAFDCAPDSIRPVEMKAKPLRAPRPQDLSLASDKAAVRLGHPMPGLREALERLRLLGEAGWPAQLAAAVGGSR